MRREKKNLRACGWCWWCRGQVWEQLVEACRRGLAGFLSVLWELKSDVDAWRWILRFVWYARLRLPHVGSFFENKPRRLDTNQLETQVVVMYYDCIWWKKAKKNPLMLPTTLLEDSAYDHTSSSLSFSKSSVLLTDFSLVRFWSYSGRNNEACADNRWLWCFTKIFRHIE